MKKFLLAVITASCVTVTSNASTISLTDGGASGNKFVSSTGAVLSSARIMVGYIENFDAGDTALVAKLKSGNLDQVLSVFVPLGENFVRGGNTVRIGNASTIAYNTSTGLISGNVGGVAPAGTVTDANTYQGNAVAVGTRFFVLALNQQSLVSTASTEFALVGADPLVSSVWTMPSNTLTNRALVLTAVDTSGEYFYGTQGSIMLQPVAVPEPATFSVLALGAMVALRRKRR